MRYLRVKNFEKYQHYKDRTPPWIKLYNEILSDYRFNKLPDANKWHLVAIWLLASRTGNKIPYDPQWIAQQISATESIDLAILIESEFLLEDQGLQDTVQVASKSIADRSRKWEPERESEGETETDAYQERQVSY